jgi:hypothetical protein
VKGGGKLTSALPGIADTNTSATNEIGRIVPSVTVSMSIRSHLPMSRRTALMALVVDVQTVRSL